MLPFWSFGFVSGFGFSALSFELPERSEAMQIFFYVAFVIAVGIAIFAVQNSDASPILIKFLIWRFETSLVYTILGSIGLGIFITLLIWIPRAVRSSLRRRKQKQDIPPPERFVTHEP
jgi:uncharacterized integral membrane protein